MQGFEMNQQHLVATILFSLILGANTFCYKHSKHWGKQYPECKGRNQSPIFINTTSDELFPSVNQTLQLTDFNKLPTKMTIRNTGHTVEIKADWSGKPPRVTGGPLHGNYVFEKTAFRWAPKSWDEDLGVNDMEMQLYFYKTDLKSFEKAESQKDGLAVFKVWLSTGFKGDGYLLHNLEKNLKKVQSINSTAKIPPFPIASSATGVGGAPIFIFYEGSLDYPPCSESVNWFIYDNNIDIPDALLNGFRKIKLAEGDVSNVRPLQALNNRQLKMVYSNLES